MSKRLLALSTAIVLLGVAGSSPATAQSPFEGKTVRIMVGLALQLSMPDARSPTAVPPNGKPAASTEGGRVFLVTLPRPVEILEA